MLSARHCQFLAFVRVHASRVFGGNASVNERVSYAISYARSLTVAFLPVPLKCSPNRKPKPVPFAGKENAR